MTDISCATWDTKEDKRMADEWAEKEAGNPCQMSPELRAEFEKARPEVEKAEYERCVECLHENVENAQNAIREGLGQREPTNLIRLDLRAEPTEKEYNEMYRIGKEIGMESWEIANYPIIMGIKDPETLERIPDMDVRVRDEISNLHNSKLAPRFRDAEVVDRIMFVDKDEPSVRKGWDKSGAVLKKGDLVGEPALSRTAHIFSDPDTGKLPEGQKTHRVVIHEICHLNMFKEKPGEASEFTKIFTDTHYDEWVKACNAQLDKNGPVSCYAEEQFPKGGPREFGFLNPEFIAEHVSYWDVDLGVEICPEMRDFFDKYLT